MAETERFYGIFIGFYGEKMAIKSPASSAGQVGEQFSLTLLYVRPYGRVVQSDLAGYLADGVAVHQSQKKNPPVHLIMDMLHNKLFDLTVGILRAY
jgi:hypothetical protein